MPLSMTFKKNSRQQGSVELFMMTTIHTYCHTLLLGKLSISGDSTKRGQLKACICSFGLHPMHLFLFLILMLIFIVINHTVSIITLLGSVSLSESSVQGVAFGTQFSNLY